jgi:flagellar biosynthesis protein FlhF
MRLVREALGENAIIVATRDDEQGGVRVTAAIDDTPLITPQKPAPAITQSDSHINDVDGSEAIEIIAEALTRHQVPSHISERLLATATQFATDDPILALGAAFDAHFQFQPITDDKADKSIMLIGPPGAGKTLCTAKFATRATLGKRSVTVISTDLDRAGGLEQLAAFTRLLKLNLVEIEDPYALREAIAMQKGSHIFVDTAGRNPFLETERQLVKEYIKASGGDIILVLPAGLDASEALDMANEFKKAGATRLLTTRIDMTRRLGSVLRVAFDTQLPLANFSASNKVTDPLLPFNPVALARLLLPRHAKKDMQASGTKT